MIGRPSLASLSVLLVLSWGALVPLETQGKQEEEYDDPDPWTGFKDTGSGPDSATVARFLAALAASDEVVCQLAVRSMGNNWNWDGAGDEMLESGAAELGVHQALSHRVTDARALARLSESLGDPKPCLRRAAARMLGNSEQAEAVSLLRAALRSSDPRTREAGALGLADAEDSAALHDLTRALEDSEPAVARMAAHALGELEDARAVKPLGQLLRAKDATTRATAARALGDIEDLRAVEALTRWSATPTRWCASPRSRRSATLKTIGPAARLPRR